ncbi:MAG TPA: hypothetical protein VJR89_24810 [Polyangiales bacterium]|nr:hypothetical protein [Polyangiales bacterium]
MRFWVYLSVALGCSITACVPEEKCGGDLYYDGVSCRKCPDDAKLKGDTCVCDESEYYEFKDNKCTLKKGAMPPEETVDAGMSDGGGSGGGDGPTCGDYCEFAKGCIGDNGIAAAALSDIVKGLKADNVSSCTNACESDLGGDGSSDPVVACIEAGRAKAACEGDSTQAGLMGAFGLLGDCCKGKTSHKLCKSICAPLLANPLTKNSVTFCN